ncbi:MAG: hypothetical protein JNM18_27240 [Planctomycetaceae bacterium]|nr:hypothetical protein [Planctomycetaceae bacterium]
MAFDLHSYHWLLNFVQAFGVAATIMVQLHRGTSEESSYHGIFFTGLLLVALATIAQFATETSSCLFSALLLVGMLLGVSIEIRPRALHASDLTS